MEKRLCEMFDYQRFENEPRLKAMLDAALKRAGLSDEEEGELSDDEVSMLNAAGTQAADPYSDREKRK